MKTQHRPWILAAVITIAFCLLVAVFGLAIYVAEAAPPPAKIAGHRGTTVGADENTMSAFAYALPYADILETDIRLTSDKKMVIMHDPTLDRTTDCNGKVAEHTLAQVKRCTTQHGHHPPSLRQLLVWADAQSKQAGLYLELKDSWSSGQVQRFVNEVASYGFADVTADSFLEANLQKVEVANDALPDENAGSHLKTGLGDKGYPRYAEPFRVCDHYDVYFGQFPYVRKAYVDSLQQVCNPPTVVALWGHLDTDSEYQQASDTGAKVIVVEDAKDARRWLTSR